MLQNAQQIQQTELDLKFKLVAEFPQFGFLGASVYLAQLGGSYERAREMLLAVQQCFKEQVGPCFMLCVLVCLLYIAAAACCFPLPASTALRHSCKLSIAVTPSKSLPGYLLCHIFGWLRLQPQCCVLFCQRIATAFSHWCLWLLLQNAQQIQQLRSELQDAQQATNQAQVEKAGAVAETDSAIAEGVHLTQQRDMWENMVEDLKKENVILKAEAQVRQLSL